MNPQRPKPPTKPNATKTTSRKQRLPIACLGVAFIILGACVAYRGVWESSGRIASLPPVTVTVGTAARWIAASFVCTGIALCGVLWRRASHAVIWMMLWLALAIGLLFVSPLSCQQVNSFTKLCQ